MDLFDVEEIQKTSDLLKAKKSRIEELEKLILKYQESYYNGEAEISDADFDKLWDELKALDPSSPLLHKVGSDSGNFPKVKHIMPMGSQEKAADPLEFLEWASTHSYPEYLVEYKLDGASLELQYENGNLINAVTRGDGSTGDCITANAKKMQGVKAALFDKDGKKVDFTGGIRGEVIMSHEVHEKYFSDKANCRNAANGLMKRKDAKGTEYLKLITYDVWASKGEQPFKDEEGKILWLDSLGFYTSPLRICKNPQEVIDYRAFVAERRASLEYDIDGLVIKERTVNHEDAMRDRPDRQIAFKFNLEEAVSVLRSVEWGEQGATYTPVGVFDSVSLNGTKVQRASLANPNLIRALGLKIGNHVTVVKRGEIIPKIVSIVHEKDEEEKLSDIIFPQRCSTCGTLLVDEGSRLYCPNRECPKRKLHQIQKWVKVLDIRDLGVTLIKNMFEEKVVTSISDLYKLTEEKLTPFFLNQESIEEKKESLGAKKVLDSIQSHRKISFAKYIAGFDIENIGETQMEKLVEAGFTSLEKLLASSEEEVAAVYSFGDILAHTLFLGLEENMDELKFLLDSSIIHLEDTSSGSLSGLSFCFTGELHSMKRSDAQNMVKERGGLVKSSVVKGLSYLVTNDVSSGSAKNKKALEYGISVIDEEKFLSLLH